MTTIKLEKDTQSWKRKRSTKEKEKKLHKVAFFKAKQHKAAADTSPQASGIQLSIHALTTFVHSQ